MTSNASAFTLSPHPEARRHAAGDRSGDTKHELALRKTYDAMPAPRLVVAVWCLWLQRASLAKIMPPSAPWTQFCPWTFTFPAVRPTRTRCCHGISVAIGRLSPAPKRPNPAP